MHRGGAAWPVSYAQTVTHQVQAQQHVCERGVQRLLLLLLLLLSRLRLHDAGQLWPGVQDLVMRRTWRAQQAGAQGLMRCAACAAAMHPPPASVPDQPLITCSSRSASNLPSQSMTTT
jgi:hypothetical protein